MATVVLAPEGDITCLRFMSHFEAGDQVIFDGDLTSELWWPSVEVRVMEMLAERER